MSSVSVYDIESGSWFLQATTGTPPPNGLAQGCTVVASAQDYSSHNIYWYGGFNGIDLTSTFSDDVYVLSVPSFTWTQVYSGTSTHGRAGHRCVKPYPDQMFVIGGYPAYTSATPTCVEGSIVQVFNLSSATWMTSYNPTIWSNYSVPAAVVRTIGGTGAGGAAKLGPSSPATWSNQTLQNVFSTAYDTTKIKNWYPYALTPTNTTTPPLITPTPAPSSSLPSWVAPVLGTVLGLVGVSAVVVCFLLWRRRRYFQRNGTLTETSDMNRYRIMDWVHSANGKAPTVTSDGMPSSPTDDIESTVGGNGQPIAEAASNQVHEMMGMHLSACSFLLKSPY
jgi:Kelch motif